MSNNYNPQGQPPPQEPQGKLILGGNPQNSSNDARRKPYQYQEPTQAAQEPVVNPQRQGDLQNHYGQQPGYQGYQQNYPRQNVQANPVPNSLSSRTAASDYRLLSKCQNDVPKGVMGVLSDVFQ